jgi:hypothetical protein
MHRAIPKKGNLLNVAHGFELGMYFELLCNRNDFETKIPCPGSKYTS